MLLDSSKHNIIIALYFIFLIQKLLVYRNNVCKCINITLNTPSKLVY